MVAPGRPAGNLAPIVFATSGHARLAYDVTGDDGGGEVFLVHAGVTDRRSWHHVVERLHARHRCVTYDMRGFGETTYEREDGWSPVADALAVLDAAGLERPIVVACSMGGQVAIDLALAHPERVGGLVLIGSAARGAPYPESEDRSELEIYERLEAAEAAGDLDEINRLEAWYWLDGPSASEGRVGGPARELFLDMNGRALRAPDRGEEAELPPAWPRLGEIAVATLVMVGRLDERGLQEIDEQAAGIIPGASFRALDGVAHLPHLEGDPVTLEAIERFLDSLSR